MKTLDRSQDKVKKICDSLRKETLEPAIVEADRIIAEAKLKAEGILKDAKEQAERLHATARADIEQERNVFNSSLTQAAKQSLETLRQDVESKLFNVELEEAVKREAAKPDVLARLIGAIVKAIDQEGIDVDLEAIIPKSVSPTEISALLTENILKRLKNGAITVGEFEGGVQVKLEGKKVTIDITDAALKELIAGFVRKDFRKMIFAN
jgi:V/A-type H+-transporting ATPase subunit E